MLTVKDIFKILLGIVIVTVMVNLAIEMFNIFISGYQLRQMIKMSARQAAELFTQETYRTDQGYSKKIYSANMEPIKYDADGDGTRESIYTTGEFYKYPNNPKKQWEDLYNTAGNDYNTFIKLEKGDVKSVSTKIEDNATTPSKTRSCIYEFENVGNVTKTKLRDIFRTIDQSCLYNDNTPTQLTAMIKSTGNSWTSTDAEKDKINRISAAINARETMHSAINSGIPFLDADVMGRMFRWNLAKILCNGDEDLIEVDRKAELEDGTNIAIIDKDEPFLNYKGFKVYANEGYITKYSYRVYDTNNASDRNDLAYLTNFNYSNTAAEAIRTNTSQADGTGENNYVTIVAINYEVPITYIGVTPLRRIVNWAWNQEVNGFDNDGTTDNTNLGIDLNTSHGTDTKWISDRENINSGSFKDKVSAGDSFDSLFTQGYLWYYIVH